MTLPPSPLARQSSDTTGFTPRQPSRLGPGPSRVSEDIGTVSLPSSPIPTGKSISDQWIHQIPHSTMQPYPSYNVPEPSQPPFPFEPFGNSSGWYVTLPPQQQHHHYHHPDPASSPDGGHPMSTDEYSTPDEYQGPPRKKRAQVRIACTHCQKACKKCSNTRPCDRCVKYGLKDCVDSVRKPRRTGVKRGPYKRRSMSKFTDFDSPSSSADSYLATQPPPHQPPLIPHQLPLDPYHRPPLHYPPGPRTAAIEGAFASALHGARWDHGHRPDKMSQQVLYPPTPNAPFPISLSGREDPFSRAVSPIHGTFGFLQSGCKRESEIQGPTLPMFQETEHVNDTDGLGLSIPNEDPNRDPNQSIPDQGLPLGVFSDPFSQTATFTPPHYTISAPTSPRNKSTDLTWDDSDLRPLFARSSSTEPVIPAHHRLYNLHQAPFHPPVHLPHALQSPAVVALTKIRKPSFRTLMSHGGSQAGSRQVSPIQESPTLFDQPMSLDDDEALSVLEGLPQAWRENFARAPTETTGQVNHRPPANLDLSSFSTA